MNLRIYGIESTLNPPDGLFGTAFDIRTAMSLVHLARLTSCQHVIFGGHDGEKKVINGYMSVAEAQLWLTRLELLATAEVA